MNAVTFNGLCAGAHEADRPAIAEVGNFCGDCFDGARRLLAKAGPVGRRVATAIGSVGGDAADVRVDTSAREPAPYPVDVAVLAGELFALLANATTHWSVVFNAPGVTGVRRGRTNDRGVVVDLPALLSPVQVGRLVGAHARWLSDNLVRLLSDRDADAVSYLFEELTHYVGTIENRFPHEDSVRRHPAPCPVCAQVVSVFPPAAAGDAETARCGSCWTAWGVAEFQGLAVERAAALAAARGVSGETGAHIRHLKRQYETQRLNVVEANMLTDAVA